MSDPTAAPAKAPRRRAAEEPPPGASRSGGWFVRLVVIAVVALWTLPTLTVLISSFRPKELVDTTS